jgi:hypothetical protein
MSPIFLRLPRAFPAATFLMFDAQNDTSLNLKLTIQVHYAEP